MAGSKKKPCLEEIQVVVDIFWSHRVPTSPTLPCRVRSLYSLLFSFHLAAQDIVAGTNGSISGELISLEIWSPDVPDLTLIDLPGIAREAVGNQPQDNGQQVTVSFICQFMQRFSSVAYLTCKSLLQNLGIIMLGFWAIMRATLANRQTWFLGRQCW